MHYIHADAGTALPNGEPAAANESSQEANSAKSVIRSAAKVGRNDPCPCGSGKKYKQCCGKLE